MQSFWIVRHAKRASSYAHTLNYAHFLTTQMRTFFYERVGRKTKWRPFCCLYHFSTIIILTISLRNKKKCEML